MQHIIEEIPYAVASCDLTFKFWIYNRKAQEIMGVKPHEMTSDAWFTEFLFTNDDGTPIKKEDRGLYKAVTHQIETTSRAIYKSPEGNIHIESHALPLYDDEQNHELTGAMVYFKDITKKIHMEQMLTEIEQKLLELKEYILKSL